MLINPFSFPGSLRGTEAIWFIRDEFCSRSYTQHFKHHTVTSSSVPEGIESKSKMYCAENYELFDYSTTQYKSSIRNILARFRSLVMHAIQENKILPKAIVFVPDDDIVKQSCLSKTDARNGEFNLIIKYLLDEIHRIVVSCKEKLPTKCKIETDPHLIWILPTAHKNMSNNTMREFFNQAVESVVNTFADNCALHLKKVWNEKDGNLYLQEQQRYTLEGLNDYWMATDAAIKFWDKTLSDIMKKRQKKEAYKSTAAHPKFKHNADHHCTGRYPDFNRNKYSWSHTNNRQYLPQMGEARFTQHGRKLPTPDRH